MCNDFYIFFFFNVTATTEIYTLSLHDALPISTTIVATALPIRLVIARVSDMNRSTPTSSVDRKSTRLNSSHSQISYAVFCLKKKIKITHVVSQDRLRASKLMTLISSRVKVDLL